MDSYIESHQPEWRRLEALTSKGSRGLASLPGSDIVDGVRLYLRASSHLAEVRTAYNEPSLEAYLNHLVTRAHAAIYASPARSARQLLRVLGEQYRMAARKTARYILVVAAILVMVWVPTELWVASSPSAQAALLPPEVREAIRQSTSGQGDVTIDPAIVSALILQNNVQVAFLAFALGITLGVGTIVVIVQNALLLGTVAGSFDAVGRSAMFWSLVLPHGFLELLAICIAGGAGLRMGWAVIDPGERPRVAALGEEAREAVLVIIGVIPAFGIAALIEGFVTGRTGMPALEVAIGAAVALAYLVFLIGRPPRATDARAP